MKKHILILLGLVITLVFFSPNQSLASEKTIPFQVSPIITENQQEGVNSYISLNIEDLDTQTIQFEVSNISNEQITLDIIPLNALTSSNGGIQYIPEKKQNTSTLTKDIYLTDLIEMPTSISLESNETKTITGTIALSKLEDSFYDLLGGVGFQVNSDNIEYKDGGTFSINNKYQTVIGVNLHYDTKSYSLEKSIDLKRSYIEQLPTYYQVMLPITFNNQNILYDAAIEYQVKDSENNTLFENSKVPFNVAPHSEAHLALPWESSTFNPKEIYRLSGVIRYDGQEYHFDEAIDSSIVISTSETTEVSLNEPPTIEQDGFSITLSLLILLLLLVAMIIAKIIYEKKRRSYK